MSLLTGKILDAKSTTFLMGAGASVSAGLPTAFALLDELADTLITHPWAATEIKRLARPDRTNQRDESDFIRFETFVDWVGDVYRDINFFRFLELYTEPSVLQMSVAEYARNGARIVTPNFDDLFERAFIKSKVMPTTINAHDANDVFKTPSIGEVIKLHGTWLSHKSGTTVRSTHPLHTMISIIVEANPSNQLQKTAKAVLENAINGQTLIVIGYSASDDLDIVPTLFGCSPREVHWLCYSNSTIEKYSLKDYLGAKTGILTTWEKLLENWEATGTIVSVYCGRGEDALAVMGIPLALGAIDSTDSIWRKEIRQWAKTVKRHDPTGLGFAGLLFGQLQLLDLSDRAFKESFGHRDSDCGWSSAKRLYEIAQNEYFRNNMDAGEVIRKSNKAYKAAVAIGDIKTVEHSLLLKARCLFWIREMEDARTVLNSPEFSRNTYRCHCISWIGRTYLWSREPRKALYYLSRACKNFRKDGDIIGFVDAEFARGVCEMHIGQFLQARDVLSENDDTCRLNALHAQRVSALTELSHVKSILGDISDAVIDIDKAVALMNGFDYDDISTTLLIKSEICILLESYIDALTLIDSAQSFFNDIGGCCVSDALALKAICEALLGKKDESNETLKSLKMVPIVQCSSFGVATANVIRLYYGLMNKTQFDSMLAFRNLNAVERFRLVLYCKRLGISTRRVTILTNTVLSSLKANGCAKWDAEFDC